MTPEDDAKFAEVCDKAAVADRELDRAKIKRLEAIIADLRTKVIDPWKVAKPITCPKGSEDARRKLLRIAYQLAARASDDPDTQNGAILVDKYGSIVGESANEFPDGINVTEERQQRPLKYRYIVHAERGAIYHAARAGFQSRGAMLVVPWFACVDCAQAIIQAGVQRVVGHKQCMDKTPERWKEQIENADALLDEARIVREYFDGEIGGVLVKFNGEDWKP